MNEKLEYIKYYNLNDIMDYLGYELDKKKSNKESMKWKDTINNNIYIVKHNVYFNVYDYSDNGSTIDFIQNNIIKKKDFKQVIKWFNKNVEELMTIGKENELNNYKYNVDEYAKIENNTKNNIKKEFNNSFTLLYQKLYTCQVFYNVRYIDKDIINYLIQQNTIKYLYKHKLLKIPLYNSLNDEIIGILNINIETSNKFLEKKSNKGLLLFGNKENFKYIFMFESFFDCLSYIQLLSIKYNTNYTNIITNNLFIVSNGSISKTNLNTIYDIITNNNKDNKIVLCFDNDKQGKKYDKLITNLVIESNTKNNTKDNTTINKILINKSINKDYNEDLKMYYTSNTKDNILKNIFNK